MTINFWEDISTRANGDDVVADWWNDIRTAGKGTVTDSITAHAGGGQGSAVTITTQFNRISTVANAADSVKLPAATLGKMVAVFNDGANAVAVFPATGEYIDALSVNASTSIIAGGIAQYVCVVSGKWKTIKLPADLTNVSGTLGLLNGGTNKAMTAINGGLVYSDADSMEVMAAGSAGQIPRSGGAGAPTWSTATYPATAGTSGNVLQSDGTNFVSASLSINSKVVSDSPNGHGSSSTKIRRYTNSTTTGTAITYADSSTLGASYTINETGIYSMFLVDFSSSGAVAIGLSVNASGAQLTTTITNTATLGSNRVGIYTDVTAANTALPYFFIQRFTAGDVVRVHDDGGPNTTNAAAAFVITKIGV
jgi:hypothetical protein